MRSVLLGGTLGARPTELCRRRLPGALPAGRLPERWLSGVPHAGLAWAALQVAGLPPPARACPAEKGRVRSFRLAAEQVDGLQVGYELILRGELLWTGDGMQAVPQSKVGKYRRQARASWQALALAPSVGHKSAAPSRRSASAEP